MGTNVFLAAAPREAPPDAMVTGLSIPPQRPAPFKNGRKARDRCKGPKAPRTVQKLPAGILLNSLFFIVRTPFLFSPTCLIVES